MDGEADSRKPLQTGALENGFEYLTDNPDNSNPVTRTKNLTRNRKISGHFLCFCNFFDDFHLVQEYLSNGLSNRIRRF